MKSRIELNTHSNYDDGDSVIRIKELVKFAKQNNMPAIALTDLNCVQGFPEFERECKKAGIKPIYGAQIVHGTYDEEYSFIITVLAKNQVGLKNLYRIISELKNGGEYIYENVPIHIMEKYHEGLLFGAKKCDYDIYNEKMLELLDYVEIDNSYSFEDEKEYNIRILEDAKEKGKLVIAVSSAKYIREDEKLSWRVLQDGLGLGTHGTENMYLRGTEEMLNEFSYLGDDLIDVVINNTNLIAEQIEDVKILPDGYYNDIFDDAYGKIKWLSEFYLRVKYGHNPPKKICERIEKELKLVSRKGCANELLFAYKLTQLIKSKHEFYSMRNTVAFPMLAYCLGIAEINPLPAHYYCPECKKVEWIKDVYCGADLPAKKCSCGGTMQGSGLNIPFEMAFQSDDRSSDIEIFTDDQTRNIIVDLMNSNELCGRILCAGNPEFMFDKGRMLINDYEKKAGIIFNEMEKEEIFIQLSYVKICDGVIPSRFFVVPRDKEVIDFTPIREEKYHGLPITYFSLSNLRNTLFNFSIRTPEHFSFFRKLGIIKTEHPASVKEMIKLVTPEITELITVLEREQFVKILKSVTPSSFADLIKIYGLSHIRPGWINNVLSLINDGVCKLSEIPVCSEDIFNDLVAYGLSRKTALRYANIVSKGLILKGIINNSEIKSFKNDLIAAGVPEWYVEYCKNVDYMFSKSYIAEEARIALLMLWYKAKISKCYSIE